MKTVVKVQAPLLPPRAPPWPYMVVANGFSAPRESLAAAAKTASSWVENGAVNVSIVSVGPE